MVALKEHKRAIGSFGGSDGAECRGCKSAKSAAVKTLQSKIHQETAEARLRGAQVSSIVDIELFAPA